MKIKHKFDKLDDMMKKEYERRVQEIEENLSDDGSFDPDKVNGKALFRRIQEQIQEQEAQKEEIKQEKKLKRYRMERAVIFSIITMVGVFCVSMTSEANRTYLNDRIQYLMGNEVVMRVGGDKGQENIESDEKELLAYQEIQEQIGIPVPIFGYKSDTQNSLKYDIIHKDSTATIKYQYGDITLDLCMINKNRAEVSGLAFHGKKIKEVDVMGGLFTISVQKIKDLEDVRSSYAAQWEYGDGYYQLNGKIKKKEFLKIIENIRY